MIIKKVSNPLSAESMLRKLQMARFPLGFSQKGKNPIDDRYKVQFDTQFYISYLDGFTTKIEKPKEALGVLGDCYMRKFTSSILVPCKVSANVTAYGVRIKDILSANKFTEYQFSRYLRILEIDVYNVYRHYTTIFRKSEERRRENFFSTIRRRCSYFPLLEKVTGLDLMKNDENLVYCIEKYFTGRYKGNIWKYLKKALQKPFKEGLDSMFNEITFAFPVSLKYSDNIAVTDMFPFFVLDNSKRKPILYYSGGFVRGQEELLDIPLEKQISISDEVLNPLVKFTKKSDYEYILYPDSLEGVFMNIKRFK